MRNSLDPLAWLDCTTTQRESSAGRVTAPTVGQRDLCGTPPKGVLHVLNRPGVSVTWERGELHFHVTPEALTKDELALLRAHKEEVGGWFLLHKLWEAGYSVQLQPSEYGPGYVLIPTGKPAQPVDFPALFDLYDKFHDQAVDLLIETCRRVGIAPEHWHRWVEKIAANSQKVLTEDESWFSR